MDRETICKKIRANEKTLGFAPIDLNDDDMFWLINDYYDYNDYLTDLIDPPNDFSGLDRNDF